MKSLSVSESEKVHACLTTSCMRCHDIISLDRLLVTLVRNLGPVEFCDVIGVVTSTVHTMFASLRCQLESPLFNMLGTPVMQLLLI